MRHHLRPSGTWILAAGAAVLGVALLGQARTTSTVATTTSEPTLESIPATAAVAEFTSETRAVPTASAARDDREPTQTPTAATGPADPAGNDPIVPAGEAGMVVSIDPETGRPGKPSAELRERLEALLPDPALDRSMAGIEIVHKPDGSMMADLQGRFADYTVIRITPDGRTIESCVQGPQVGDALHGAHDRDETPAPPAPKHEVR